MQHIHFPFHNNFEFKSSICPIKTCKYIIYGLFSKDGKSFPWNSCLLHLCSLLLLVETFSHLLTQMSVFKLWPIYPSSRSECSLCCLHSWHICMFTYRTDGGTDAGFNPSYLCWAKQTPLCSVHATPLEAEATECFFSCWFSTK